MTARALGIFIALAALLGPQAVQAADSGEGIYRFGKTATGRLVEASRSEGTRIQGAVAACVNCHQRSGLGTTEGRSVIPPITGRYLFRPRAKDDNERDLPFVPGMRGDREPYTDATLTRAIREGIDSEGKPLNYLMPRFAIGDADMAALIAYLKRLDHRRVPGVTGTVLHLATIITPDADPVKRRAMLDVMRQFVADRNVRQMVTTPPMQSSGRTAYAKSKFLVHRQWELHVWELSGPASGWPQQLDKYLAAEPVFAVLSGLGGSNWAPVQEFCERQALPCLFPNVEVPVDRHGDFYSMYFSKAVLLEAELMAYSIAGSGDAKAHRKVLQVYRSGDSGEVGAATLAGALKRSGVSTSSVALPPGPAGQGLAQALYESADADAVVLWLRPQDLAALGNEAVGPQAVYVSGLMGGLEHAPLPPAWRSRVRIAYPFDLPERRRVRVDYALGWFRARHISVRAEQVQADTYLACSLVSETMNHLSDSLVREYLLERLETMLEHRIVTGYYPRLALATGERFASKGGYVVRFAEPAGYKLVSEQNWIVP